MLILSRNYLCNNICTVLDQTTDHHGLDKLTQECVQVLMQDGIQMASSTDFSVFFIHIVPLALDR
jgi:hypothetical protein